MSINNEWVWWCYYKHFPNHTHKPFNERRIRPEAWRTNIQRIGPCPCLAEPVLCRVEQQCKNTDEPPLRHCLCLNIHRVFWLEFLSGMEHLLDVFHERPFQIRIAIYVAHGCIKSTPCRTCFVFERLGAGILTWDSLARKASHQADCLGCNGRRKKC